MSVPFLPAIDLETYTTAPGLGPQALSYIGSVWTKITPATIEQAFLHLQQTFGRFRTYFDVTAVDAIEDVVSLLDSGAAKAIVTQSQYDDLANVQNIDLERVALSGSGEFVDVPADFDDIGAIAGYAGIPIIPATRLTVDGENSSKISVASLLLARSKSDRADGLVTTLVTDERDTALGLVYSSRESVAESLRTGRGVYQSRKRGLWYKGESSGDTQELVRIDLDCDGDCLRFVVRQGGKGFCHLGTASCFGQYRGLSRLQKTLHRRKDAAPRGSYTARLFNDPQLLRAKIMEEANELCEAQSREDVTFEAADLMYFALAKCIAAGVSLEDVEQNLDAKSVKVRRRRGDAKPLPFPNPSLAGPPVHPSSGNGGVPVTNGVAVEERSGRIKMKRYNASTSSHCTISDALQRPSQRSMDTVISIVKPIIDDVRANGDKALLEYTKKFDRATHLTTPVLRAPFPSSLMVLSPETISAIDVSYNNIRRFHSAQREEKPLSVETMPGVVCSRFSRPIERVGLYVPGGTAVLPSTALMLGVPAQVAGCSRVVLASPPRPDGSITPEIVYIAHKIGAESIVLAGGAQAVAAMAYGTESICKVDKILGPGNQFVTAAKMLISNDTMARISIDMPAGPSEVLVVADKSANPAFVASDLLSQAEHGPDSQVVLVAVDLGDEQLEDIENEVHKQASALPRVGIVRQAIDHSVTLLVKTVEEALKWSNFYAPEHLILQVQRAEEVSQMVQNAGSVFIGSWTPESVGDYSAGVNHSLPTYGYARQYSGVNLASYLKHITSSQLTAEGLRNVGGAVMQLAKVEELEAHRRAVEIRLDSIDAQGTNRRLRCFPEEETEFPVAKLKGK